MSRSDASQNESPGQVESSSEERQQKLAILGLFRLLETAVQTTQLKVAGQMVLPVQEIVGVVLSARSEFDAANNPEAALLALRQAADAFRFKIVRWEAEARAAQAGQRPLTEAQKRQLPAEIPAVRSTARKTQIFFDRLVTALETWARSKRPDQGHEAVPSEADNETGSRHELEVRDGFTFMGGTETDEDGITLVFSLTSTKQFLIKAADIREASTLQLRFRNSSAEPARLQLQLYNGKVEPILNWPATLRLPATQDETSAEHTVGAATNLNPTVDDTQVVTVEFINVPEEVEISRVTLTHAEADESRANGP